MSRYIDADVLQKDVLIRFYEDYRDGFGHADIASIIDKQPTVDAVPVVRCKDCKHWEEESTFCLNKEGCYGSETTADWFCADGERRSDD